MGRKKLVHIVEDDKIFQEILVHHLTFTFNFEVEAYSSGEECIANFYKNPDFYILDYNLLNINGLEVLKKIKEKDQDKHVIVVSSEEKEIGMESLRAGAFDFISKDDYTLENITEKIKMLENLKEVSSIRLRRISILGFTSIKNSTKI